MYGLRLRTPRLELRLANDDELVELAHVAEQGVHPSDEMPFRVRWTDGIGRPGFVESFVEYHRSMRRNWERDNWTLELSVWAGEQPMGFQALGARDFATTRLVGTMSWLGLRFQRQGYGTEMRRGVLTLAFDGLGAVAAKSGYVEGNVASARVSGNLGYGIVGEDELPDGRRETNVRLERLSWHGPHAEIEGLEPCLPLFGL